jgi:hypothetical protein
VWASLYSILSAPNYQNMALCLCQSEVGGGGELEVGVGTQQLGSETVLHKPAALIKKEYNDWRLGLKVGVCNVYSN